MASICYKKILLQWCCRQLFIMILFSFTELHSSVLGRRLSLFLFKKVLFENNPTNPDFVIKFLGSIRCFKRTNTVKSRVLTRVTN